MSPRLQWLDIGDDPSAWEAAGFAVNQNEWVEIGGVMLRLVGPGDGTRRGIRGWTFFGLDINPLADTESSRTIEIDGILTTATNASHSPSADLINPNGAVHLDHVVMFSSDLGRSIDALAAAGFEARRTRDIPRSDPPRQQVFLWAGDTIIELVGPATPDADPHPSSLWGLAVSVTDLDETATRLGDALGPIKTAVQAGRRIATVRTRDLDISVPIAFMTPHSPGSAS